MVDDGENVREGRLRRMADRRGLTLLKAPQSDPQQDDYGTYVLVETDTATIRASGSPAGYGLTLDEVEDALER